MGNHIRCLLGIPKIDGQSYLSYGRPLLPTSGDDSTPHLRFFRGIVSDNANQGVRSTHREAGTARKVPGATGGLGAIMNWLASVAITDPCLPDSWLWSVCLAYSHSICLCAQLEQGWLRSHRRFFSRQDLHDRGGRFHRCIIITGAPL